jgi:Leucine-rich repeat (LRR) protein
MISEKIKQITFSFLCCSQILISQTKSDSLQQMQTYNNLEEALKVPEKVFRLDLGNQKLKVEPSFWQQFPNLEYLSLKNDHLKFIPKEISGLKNLKVLDLSGNDFSVLPNELGQLSHLEELFLNDDKYFILNQNVSVLSQMPMLKKLHIENDNLDSIPNNMSKLEHLEMLFLNQNKFRHIPLQIKDFKSLQYLNIHNNKLTRRSYEREHPHFGIKIEF